MSHELETLTLLLGLSELVLEGGVVGETFGHIIGKQFHQLKYGDRFWHETPDEFVGFTDGMLIN